MKVVKTKEIYFPCDDDCTYLNVKGWEDEDSKDWDLISVSFLTNRLYADKYHGFFGRLRAAWATLWGKEISYAEVLMDTARYRELLREMSKLADHFIHDAD